MHSHEAMIQLKQV